mmetsp:Transcript_34651/g.62865  ORF Transcript_34651/g.62865 Transcript_34651/m.62865 type:complete len:247 (-) Transcript_34651:307-1047(-)
MASSGKAPSFVGLINAARPIDCGARFSSSKSSFLPRLARGSPSSFPLPSFPFPFPLPLRPSFGSCAKALLETFENEAAPASSKSSFWNLGPSSSSRARLVSVLTVALPLRHSARSSSICFLWEAPRGAFLGSKSTHKGGPSPSAFFLTPSVFHNKRVSFTSLSAFQDSTSFSTQPPSTCTESGPRRTCPFCTLNGHLLVEMSKSFVPGGRWMPRLFVDSNSRPLNFWSPMTRSKTRRRHLPPSNSS